MTSPHRPAGSLRIGEKRTLSNTSTGSEQLEGEHGISLSRRKCRITDKFKRLFTSKSKITSQTHMPGVPGENIHPVEDQGSSYATNRETSADQLIPYLATVDAAREGANRAVSEMMATSPIRSVDNPISLVLNKLASFNSVVDKIATIHPYAQAAWAVLSLASKTIIGQTTRDNSVYFLLAKIDEVYTFLTQAELRDIEFMKTVVERMCHQTLECSYFIREYSQNKEFRARLLENFISETDARVKCYNDIFDELLQQFRDKAAGNTLVVVHRIWESLGAQAEASDLNSAPYVGGAGLDTRKICLEGTRHEILDEITAWINNIEDNPSRVLWLYGEAGTGKSSIAHTIADRFQKLGRLGSCYCFDRNQMAEQRDRKIFTTIARDLADRDKQMRRELANAIHQNTSLKHTTDILQQWKELIMKPAKAFSETMAGPIVIVIDGLDESGLAASREYLLRIFAGKLDDNESIITELPPHIRILLTSRPLPDIADALNGVEHVQSKSMFSIPSALSQRDISRYVSCQLSGLEGIEIEDISASLTSASDGLFEWARLACAYVKGDDNAGLTVTERFEAVITHDRGLQIPLLDSMYKLTLEGIFPFQQDKRPLARFQSVMEQILATAEPLSLSSLTSMRHHFIDEDLRMIDINTIIKHMGALLSGTTDPSVVIRPLHASFSDFLTDENRSGEFFIDLSHIHENLAGASLGIMEDGLQFNICQLPTSYLPNSKFSDLDERIKEYISPELSYSCRCWTDHLQLTQFDLALAQAIQAFFNHERLLFWLEVLSLLQKIDSCNSGLSLVIQWAMSHAEWQDIIDDALDAQKFVQMFGGAISFSTPHLYLSALPFTPNDSQISKKFGHKMSQVLKHVSDYNLRVPILRHVVHRHRNRVGSVAFSPDGKCIVSGSDDKTIRLWDAETGKILQQPLEGHEDRVRSVAFSPDGKCIVSGSADKTIRLWDVETGEMLLPPLIGHTDWVRSVAFSPDGKYIVSGSNDKTIQLWNAQTGEMLQPPLEGHEDRVRSVVFSPDGKQVVSGSSDKTIRLWDAETGEMLQSPFEGHENGVSSVAFSPNGKHIVSGSFDKTIRLWDVKTGEMLQPPLKGHEDNIRSVAFSPNGKHIVSGSFDTTIRLWDAETWKMLHPPLEGHKDRVQCVAFSPDGKHIVSASDQIIQLWVAETGVMVQPSLEDHDYWVQSVPSLPDGKYIVSERGSDNETTQFKWDAKTGEMLQPTPEGYDARVLSIAFSPDGKCIVSGLSDKTVRLWDAETGEMLLPPFKGHKNWVHSVAFSPDGKYIVSGSDDNTVRVWDAKRGAMLYPPLKGHKDRVRSVTFSPNGKHIASGSYDKTIRIWDAKTGKILQPPLEGHEGRVRSVAFSPDGKCIVSGSVDTGTIQLWDAETGAILQLPLEGHDNGIISVAFSPDGKHIVSGSIDKTIRLWDAKTGVMLLPPLEGHEDGVLFVTFSPDGKFIVSGSYDNTIRLWDTETGKMLQPLLEGHDGRVQSIAFSPDGKYIASGSFDKTIRIWNAETRAILQSTLDSQMKFTQSILSDGKPIASGTVSEGQHLISFSPHPEYALIDIIELFHDNTPLSPHKLVDLVDINGSGWVYIGPEKKLLLWIPPIYHPLWYSPNTHMIIPVPIDQLDLSNMAHGHLWELCYARKET